MNFFRWVLRNIEGNSFRSLVIFVCAEMMSGLVIAAMLIIGGAQQSLNLALSRLGADIVVVPIGSEQNMENAFMMGAPSRMWMPANVTQQVAAVSGVEAVSPQLFLSTLRAAVCCAVPDMFLVAYDPATDFTLKPWLEAHVPKGLAAGQVIGGTYVFLPKGQTKIPIYGENVELVGNLEPTGTGLDQSMFFTFDTALQIAKASLTEAQKPLEIPDGNISAVMVKVSPTADRHAVADAIKQQIPDVTPVESSLLFSSHRAATNQLLGSFTAMTVVVWILSIALIILVFSLSINERKREIGVLRALGATSSSVLKSLLAEGLLIAMAGGTGGVILFSTLVYLLHDRLVEILSIRFLLPSPLGLIGTAAGGLFLVMLSVSLAALYPALYISRMDPSAAMRE